VDVDAKQLHEENDAVVICTGATWPRDLKIPNRGADGVHFAMDFLQVCYTKVRFHVFIIIDLWGWTS
jgi:NADPH-dependent glutamate synthase beta subunit-like oxidoreductase